MRRFSSLAVLVSAACLLAAGGAMGVLAGLNGRNLMLNRFLIVFAIIAAVAVIAARGSSTAPKTYTPHRMVILNPTQTIPLPGPVASGFGAMVFLNGSLADLNDYVLHQNTTLTGAGVEESWSIRFTNPVGPGTLVQILYFSER